MKALWKSVMIWAAKKHHHLLQASAIVSRAITSVLGVSDAVLRKTPLLFKIASEKGRFLLVMQFFLKYPSESTLENLNTSKIACEKDFVLFILVMQFFLKYPWGCESTMANLVTFLDCL